MKLISHRGNIIGPIPDKENRPSYIDCAIQLGYEVEIDIRYINNQFWLGHDTPDYKINREWLEPRLKYLWLHCKDVAAAYKLKEFTAAKYFCHSIDTYVLTSTRHLWVHDLTLPLTESCIIPLLSKEDIDTYPGDIVHGICTDYVTYCKYKCKI